MPVLSNTLPEPGYRSNARCWLAVLTVLLALVLGACAAPQTGPAGSAVPASGDPPRVRNDAAAQPIATAPMPPPGAQPPRAASPTATTPPRGKPAPPMSDPLPAQRVPDAAPAPARLDVSCRTSADCAVKDVGNCCGYFPRCVNVNAAVDPKAVQAQCARSGMVSVCGFKPVESCECVRGECRDQLMMVEGQ